MKYEVLTGRRRNCRDVIEERISNYNWARKLHRTDKRGYDSMTSVNITLVCFMINSTRMSVEEPSSTQNAVPMDTAEVSK